MWLIDLFTQPSYLQLVLILSVVCAIGLSLGQISIKGVSLGVTLVFFAGIVGGEVLDRIGVPVDSGMISFAQNFGLILFVYALGVQVGPGFFASMKKGGIHLIMYGLLAILLTTISTIAVFAITSMTFPEAMGVLSGSVTNTPMLGAAQQSLLDIHPEEVQQANDMATACAVGYPFGVIGVLISMIILKAISKDKLKREAEPTGDTYVAEFKVNNPAIFGKTIYEVTSFTKNPIIISRISRNGKVTIPASTTVLQENDHLMAVLRKDDVESFKILFGGKENKDWNNPDIDWNNIDGSGLVSAHVLVTKKELNGVKIGTLHLRNTLGINITRVGRAGIQLVAYPGLRLQLGDRLTIVGEQSAINKVGEILGNEVKELKNPNLVALFVGLFLGVVLGSIPIVIPGMSTPIKLGIAGGPILVGILMGAYGSRLNLTTYSTRSANLMLRQFGIVLYLACLGLNAGAGFFETVFCSKGLMWILVSLFIATVPVLITGYVAKKWGGLDYAQNAGLLCAAMANPMALTYANTNSDEQEASEAYATVYPFGMFVRVISAQLLMLIFV